MHTLLVALLVSQTGTEHIVGGPFDIALIISAYFPGSNTYKPATAPNRYCAWMQYVMRSILVHLMRLGGFKKGYMPYECDESDPSVSGSAEDASSADEVDAPTPANAPSGPLDLDEDILDDEVTAGEDEVPDTEFDAEDKWMFKKVGEITKEAFTVDDDVDGEDEQQLPVEIKNIVEDDEHLRYVSQCAIFLYESLR